jgi:hypothetical protein
MVMRRSKMIYDLIPLRVPSYSYWTVVIPQGKALEKGTSSLQQPYIRVVSMREETGDSHSRFNFT